MLYTYYLSYFCKLHFRKAASESQPNTQSLSSQKLTHATYILDQETFMPYEIQQLAASPSYLKTFAPLLLHKFPAQNPTPGSTLHNVVLITKKAWATINAVSCSHRK